MWHWKEDRDEFKQNLEKLMASFEASVALSHEFCFLTALCRGKMARLESMERGSLGP